MLYGGRGLRESRAIASQLTEMPEDEHRVLLATGRYIGEGFDDSRLDTLFLTLPVSWRGTVAQYVGRLHRLHEDKTEVRVYDYADLNVLTAYPKTSRRAGVPVLRRGFRIGTYARSHV